MHLPTRIAALGAGPALMAITPAHAQQAERTKELFHIFDIRTQAQDREVIRALTDQINISASDSETVTPLIRGAPPQKAGTFELVDAFAEGRLGGLGVEGQPGFEGRHWDNGYQLMPNDEERPANED